MIIRNTIPLRYSLPSLALAALVAVPAQASKFIPLTTTRIAKANAVSRDGFQVVGLTGDGPSQAFQYIFGGKLPTFGTPTAPPTNSIVELGTGPNSLATGISGNRKFILGGNPAMAFVWSQPTGPVPLNPLPPSGGRTYVSSAAAGISYDGQVASGISTDNSPLHLPTATIWRKALPAPLFNGPSTAAGMSADARLIAGSVTKGGLPVAAMFTLGSSGYTETDLPTAPGKAGQGINVSSNGKAIVGAFITLNSSLQPSGSQAVKWSYPFTSATPLPDLPGGSGNTQPFANSADGSVTVGSALNPSLQPTVAVYWDAGGVHNLQAELIAQGLGTQLAGWNLLATTGCSADGTIMCGFGAKSGNVYPFWVHLTRPLHLYNVMPLNDRVIGGNDATGVVALSGAAPAGGTVVTLTTDLSYTHVPASVTVLETKSTATFTIHTDGTSIERLANITGKFGGHSINFVLTVLPAEMKQVQIIPTTVIGGNAFPVTVFLNGHAPAGGSTVQLASLKPAAATIQSSAMFGNNATRTDVTARSLGVATSTSVAIRAIYRGVTMTDSITVTPANILDITCSSPGVQGGKQVTFIIHLTGNTPSSGANATLASSDPAVVPVPATLALGSQVHYKAFNIVTNAVQTTKTVTITATYRGFSQSVSLLVKA